MLFNWKEILPNILFWMGTSWLIINGSSIQTHQVEIVNGLKTVKTIRNNGLVEDMLLCIILSVIMFYTNVWNINRLISGKRKKIIILISVLLPVITIIAFKLIKATGSFQFDTFFSATVTSGIIFFYFTISLAYGLGKVYVKSELSKQQLLTGKKQAELTLLRNQLQPHFLFNALNNLLSMVDQRQSPQLSKSIERLSLLLRYVVDETKQEYVTIRQEIDFIKNYCELQKLRFEENEIELKLDITGDFDKQLIEPGIFIPFVENALKYGAAPEQKSVIQITFDISNEYEIKFSIINPVLLSAESSNTGTGIAAARKRLQLIYPDRHEILIQAAEEFIVDLRIITR